MPPAPEPNGTIQADIYALGMTLYVAATGRKPAFFPELSSTLLERTGDADFMVLNPIIIKACHPDCAKRYKSAAEMCHDLHIVQKALEPDAPTEQA
jgi:serine/threonine protein kinase